jgi:hypothetical protein
MRVDANAVATAPPVTFAIPDDRADLLVLDASFGGHLARRLLSRTGTLEPMRRLPPATLETSVEGGLDSWSVHLSATGDIAAIEVRIDDVRAVGWPERAAWAYVDRNIVTLLPGESRVVRVDWCDVPPDDRAVGLSGWNVAERVLAGG